MNLINSFNKYFKIELAQTFAQRQKVYKLRYRVYCHELGYLDQFQQLSDNEEDRIEKDEFDDRSLHCLITHRKSSLPAGCVRLITSQDTIYDEPLPMEKFCMDALSLGALELLGITRSRVGEISRLAVDPMFRRRGSTSSFQVAGDVATDFDLNERKAFSLISVAGMMAMAVVAELIRKTDIFAMMDPALPRLMQRSGFKFNQVGNVIQYHGQRAPYHIKVGSYHDAIPELLKDFFYGLYQEFESQYPGLGGLRALPSVSHA